MQNTIQKFRQSSIVFKKPGVLSESLNTFTTFNYPAVKYFLLKLRPRVLYLPMSSKGCVGFFYFI